MANDKTLQKHRVKGYLIASLGKRLTEESSCAMCRFLSSLKARPGSPAENFQLLVHTSFCHQQSLSTQRLPPDVRSKDLPHFVVAPSDSVIPRGWSYAQAPAFHLDSKALGIDTVFMPRVATPQVDYRAIGSWVKYCNLKHTSLCKSSREQVPGMKLMEISSSSVRVVSAPPDAPYIALSYVWGDSKAQDHRSCAYATRLQSQTPMHLLKVVVDAIEVVRNLGYQYLWVDRHCIDQNNHAEKERQIKLMESIYRGAEFTIVAVAGTDSSFGLPGVGTALRKPQPMMQVKDITLISSVEHPQRSIQNSMWSKRAWTFQEGLLSSRLLFFTEHEVYFECHSMQCRETMEAKWDPLHCKQGKLYAALNSGLYLGKSSSTSSYIHSKYKSLFRYHDLIQQHTRRCLDGLRYPKEILVSFTGIIKHLEKGKFPHFQLWGVPFLFSPDPLHEVFESFLIGLLWVHKHGLTSTSRHPKRRLGFPSWTWAGWHGEAQPVMQYELQYAGFEAKLLELQIELEKSTCIRFNTLLNNFSPEKPIPSTPTALILKCMVLDPESYIFRVNSSSHLLCTHCCITSTINPPPVDRKKVIFPYHVRVGRKSGKITKYIGLKAELYLSEGRDDGLDGEPYDRPGLRRLFASGRPKLVLLGTAPLKKTENLPDIYFLVLKQNGSDFNRMGVLNIRENWNKFKNNFALVEQTIRLT